MKINRHAQSCFLLETDDQKILVDPGYFVFEKEGLDPNAFQNIDVVVITHEHKDHFDTERFPFIYKNNQPVVFSTQSVVSTIKEMFSEADTRVLKPGDRVELGSIAVEGYQSQHGPLPTGAEPPEVIGVVIDDGTTRFYTPGDSIYLNKDVQADVIATPVCGHVVMDIATAKKELLELKPKIAIPIHGDNPNYPVDFNDFAKAMVGTGVEVKILEFGGTLEV